MEFELATELTPAEYGLLQLDTPKAFRFAEPCAVEPLEGNVGIDSPKCLLENLPTFEGEWGATLALLQTSYPAGVYPSPATHAILTFLKAGERVFQTLLLTKTVVHAYRGGQPLFHALFWRQNAV